MGIIILPSGLGSAMESLDPSSTEPLTKDFLLVSQKGLLTQWLLSPILIDTFMAGMRSLLRITTGQASDVFGTYLRAIWRSEYEEFARSYTGDVGRG